MSALIRSIIEDKFSAYLAANITNTNVVKGITDGLRSMPSIVVYANNASKPMELGANQLGNYHVKLEIFVYSSADDETLQAHRERVSKVHGLMSDLIALKALWLLNEGKLYQMWIEEDEEGMHSRNYGNRIVYTIVAVLPPSPV